MKCSCGLRVVFTLATVVGPALFEFAYLLLVNCSCGSTRAAVIWEAEDESDEAIAAE